MSRAKKLSGIKEMEGRAPGVEPERSEGGAEGARPGAPRRFQRLWATRKGEAVIRLLGGEEPNALAQEHGVTVTDLMLWKEKFIQGGIDGLKRRERDDSQETRELRAKVGELTMELEVHRKNRPAPGRSRRHSR